MINTRNLSASDHSELFHSIKKFPQTTILGTSRLQKRRTISNRRELYFFEDDETLFLEVLVTSLRVKQIVVIAFKIPVRASSHLFSSKYKSNTCFDFKTLCCRTLLHSYVLINCNNKSAVLRYLLFRSTEYVVYFLAMFRPCPLRPLSGPQLVLRLRPLPRLRPVARSLPIL